MITRDYAIEQYGPILAEHGQWWVMKTGLVAVEEGYFIERAEVAATRADTGGLSEWVVHVAEKNWCRPRDLINSIKAAIKIYGLASDIDWSATELHVMRDAYQAFCDDFDARGRKRTPIIGGVYRMSDLPDGEDVATQLWDPGRTWDPTPSP